MARVCQGEQQLRGESTSAATTTNNFLVRAPSFHDNARHKHVQPGYYQGQGHFTEWGQKGERQWVSRSESLRKLTESFGSGLRPDPLNPRACATRARRKEQALPAAARPPRARPGRFASGDLQLRGPSARSSTESSVYRVWFRQAIHFVSRQDG